MIGKSFTQLETLLFVEWLGEPGKILYKFARAVAVPWLVIIAVA